MVASLRGSSFGLLDFTMLRPVLLGACFKTYEPFISLIFQISFSGRGKPPISETAQMGVRLYNQRRNKLDISTEWPTQKTINNFH
jgi:hypothetical protein